MNSVKPVLRLVRSAPRISSSDLGAIEEIDRRLTMAKTSVAMGDFVQAGCFLTVATSMARRIHDQALCTKQAAIAEQKRRR